MTQTVEYKATVTKPGEPRSSTIHLDEDTARGGPVFRGTDVPVQYLFEYLDRVHNLHAFLDDFPEVSMEQALTAVRKRLNANSAIHSDRNYVSGTPVFKGTRLPVRLLFDYLAHGHTVESFLDSFDTSVTKEQAAVALEMAREALESIAYETTAR